ncbi:hypothetical protein NQ317_017234 [Molorchus minor]|uniref:Protein ANTAGONIST OF LIKE HETEROCHROMATIN PROTEIN 1-like n=1 Tax=Molorchus minor TaxID=1323400 RepID=A0ABQ9JHA4_9CUCU|nr:hypothetical protein NQ317_017234 [Molorchus minor]
MAGSGFVKATSGNLPAVDVLMVAEFMKRDKRFNIAEDKIHLKNCANTLLKNCLRMSETDFNFLLQLVSDKISKLNTNMRDSIKARERLALTLRFLATGDSYHSLMYLFRIPVCTISKIIPECCEALNEVLKNDYFKVSIKRFC